MYEPLRTALSKELFAFVNYLRREGFVPQPGSERVMAEAFTRFFHVPCPMLTTHASGLLEQVDYNEVYLQPGLEKYLHTRGQWRVEPVPGMDHQLIVVILIEEARPDPSKIRSLLHELVEQIAYIYYDGHPEIAFTDAEREEWANRFAAYVKMPKLNFLPCVNELGLDHPKIASVFDETLAAVSRHFRDLVMKSRPYYFGRVRVEPHPERYCPNQGIEEALRKTGGFCVKVVDAVKTDAVKGRLKRGALPLYNVGIQDEYRVVNPEIEGYLETKKPIYIPSLYGATGHGGPARDLFEEQRLSVMIYPTPYPAMPNSRKAKGFFIVAVHPRDACLLEKQQLDAVPAWRPDIDWVFDWAVARFRRDPDDEIEEIRAEQKSFHLWDETTDGLPSDRTRWPRVSPITEFGFDGNDQGLLFNDGEAIELED